MKKMDLFAITWNIKNVVFVRQITITSVFTGLQQNALNAIIDFTTAVICQLFKLQRNFV